MLYQPIFVLRTFRTTPGDLMTPDRPIQLDGADAAVRRYLRAFALAGLGSRTPLWAQIIRSVGNPAADAAVAAWALTPSGVERRY